MNWLRLKAEEVRGSHRKPNPNCPERVNTAQRLANDRAGGFEHLALLLEHHPQGFPDVPEERMPPCEFAKFRSRPEPKSLGGSSAGDCAGGGEAGGNWH